MRILSVHCYNDNIYSTLERIQSINKQLWFVLLKRLYEEFYWTCESDMPAYK